MKISVELVPRDVDYLKSELELIYSNFPQVNTINIPDLLRVSTRSWEGCAAAKHYFKHSISHIRAMDVNLKEPFSLIQYLDDNNINEILVITGDSPQDINRRIYPTTAIDLIHKIKKEHPHINIYAAIDPYRDSIRKELEYMERKRDAGADGFFTQPFFDVRFMEIYAEKLQDIDVFWGVSPVTSERSRNYWETKNHAIFPQNFEPTLDWNVRFAKQTLQFAKRYNGNVYFMPIKLDTRAYLGNIFE